MTKTALKSSTAVEAPKEATIDRKEINKIVDKAIKSIPVFIQSASKFQIVLQDAMIACLAHAKAFGDVLPMDRLVKAIPEDNHAVSHFRSEMVAYLRDFSPIRWNAKKEPHQAKPTDKDYKPYDVEGATAVPFFETDKVLEARTAAGAASDRTLNPVTFGNALARIEGLRKWFKTAVDGNAEGTVRGVASKEDEAKILGLLDTIDKSVTEYKKHPQLPASQTIVGSDRKARRNKPAAKAAKAVVEGDQTEQVAA